MSTNEEQTVVDDTDAQSVTDAEASQDARQDGPDALDKLLAQYEKEASQSSSTPGKAGGGASEDPSKLLERLDALELSLTKVQTGNDLRDTINTIRGDLDPEAFDDDLVEGWLDKQAQKDPRLRQAWIDRHDNPKAFAKVKDQLARQFTSKFSKLPNREATDDREAVAAAVRGASTKAPEGKAPDYGGLSDQEYAEKVEKEHGFRPI